MPFTASHPAAVLPLLRTPLPASALVIGSMAPDSPGYIPAPFAPRIDGTHSTTGVFTVDVALGLTIWLLWHVMLSGPALAAAPRGVRARWGAIPIGVRARLRRPRDLFLLVAGLAVGSVTHVLWDGFTHQGGWFVDHMSVLRERHLGFSMWTVAQVGCSIFGLVVCAIALASRYRRAPVVADVPAASPGARLAWAAIGGAGLVGAVHGLNLVHRLNLPPYLVPVEILTGSITLAGVAAGTLATVWHVQRLNA
ncbi:MAG TPA: DUF4184 family protein [Sporichthyaceae bacterium]|jgi:hypothetical protein